MSYALIFERSRPRRRGLRLVEEVPEASRYIPERFLRKKPPRLPEVDELTLVRHYTGLSRRQVGVDTTFSPLGSCTMTYNPKLPEEAVRLFADLHPYQDPKTVQGALELMWQLGEYLKALTGLDAITLQPAAGAHGELTGILIIRAYHEDRG
ncbi:MAG: aminomethyl-transferring glycine dehydrogenase subunit GcvPB, partial [Thermus sp.]|nr:aminomethyl-transferring glycine dehydrogenase subunit GcvPB [Thermus sp.]